MMLSGVLLSCKAVSEGRFCPYRSPKPQCFEFYSVFFSFIGSQCLELRPLGTL